MELLDLSTLLPHAQLDIRYAGANNFIGQQVYPLAKAYLVADASKALQKANDEFNAKGFGLLIWDAYRPYSVTKIFWERTPEYLRSFLGDPASGGSPHNRGCAIDLTLYDLATGQPLKMPTEFDDFTAAAKMDYTPADAEIRSNRNLLQQIMEKYGFTVREDEWWHYNWEGYEKYPLLDIPFNQLSV